jgi:hypothetical protein
MHARITAEVAQVDPRGIRKGLERKYLGDRVETPDAQGKLPAVGAYVDNRIEAKTAEYAVMLSARGDSRTQHRPEVLGDRQHAQDFG